MKKLSPRDRLIASIAINVLLAAALLLLLLTNRKEEPLLPVNEEALMLYAFDYDVSTEYLRLVVPDYLIYAETDHYVFEPLDPKRTLSDYDWDKLSFSNGRALYTDENYPNVRYGIDVSAYQGDINWQAVATDNVQFAIVRLAFRGYKSGLLYADEYAVANLDGAAKAGLPIGGYVFSQAVTEKEAEEEAEMAISLLQGRTVEYPVVFDMEEMPQEDARANHLSVEERTKIALAFCRKIEQAGYQPMIYGNMRFLCGRIDLTELKNYPVWFAQYYQRALYPYQFFIWQYSSSGTVSGINGNVDLNICFDPSFDYKN